MDPKIVKEVLDFKLHNQYPEGLTSKEKLFSVLRASRRGHLLKKTQYSPIVVSEPLELVGMDLVGNLTLTDGVVADHPKDWDQYLQSTMFALRTKKQLTTKFSPDFLMFGREARYPSEVDEEYEVTDDKVNRLLCLEEISEGAHKRQSVYEDVKHNVKKSQDRIMYLKEKRSLFVDPFGATQQQTEQCRDVTRHNIVWSVCVQELILNEDPVQYPVDQEGVASLRLDMAMSLLNDTDDLSQLCRACGEESSGADTDDWIECTTCNKWYHTVCVGHPSTEGDYFHNYFSGQDILRYLKEKNSRYTGTVRDNRTGNAPLRLIKEMIKKAVPRGTCDYITSDDGILMVRWKDNEVVAWSSVYRYCSDTKRKEQVSCPYLIESYNANMGGIDKSDMLVHLYRTLLRAKR
ncbi:hypothetical protein DPEC_G00098460 [Dallia pectoralis]|uniref:Uncharacterized protein n=1 Tax=Dallia pectoralis TaxID=75939 RepID=A0ACC2GVV0_DALPE|nr:hypothetical protein DPEC_G00098460 [Dallia pectoralis]